MIDSTKQLNDHLRILNAHYQDFNIGKFQFFLSFFEDGEGHDYVTKKYETIAKDSEHQFTTIRNLSQLEEYLSKPVYSQMLNPVKSRTFENQTFLIDFYDNKEKVEMIKKLYSLTHHLYTKSQIYLHTVFNITDIHDYIGGSDLWEFRSQTFTYKEGLINKIALNEDLESKLKSKEIPIKKMKI